MAHNHHGLNLLHGLEGNAHHNQQGRAAKVHAFDVGGCRNHVGQHRDEGQEDGAGQSDAGHDMVKIVCRRLARADARDEAAVFLEVLCHIRYLYSNRSIEVSKEHDEQDVQCRLQWCSPLQITGNGLYPGHFNELGNGHWKHQHG